MNKKAATRLAREIFWQQRSAETMIIVSGNEI
jgi:hypothetical protein